MNFQANVPSRAFFTKITFFPSKNSPLGSRVSENKQFSSVSFQMTLLLGSVTALGAVTKLTHVDAAWIAFNVGQGLQGIFIAMLVTCNCQVLKIYTRSIKTRGTRFLSSYGNVGENTRAGRGTELSKSTSLQLLTWEPTPDAV